MNAPDSTPEVDLLVTADERRQRITVNDHAAFRQSITTPPELDEIDLLAADGEMMLNKRSSKDANRVLDILDELERTEA